MRAIIVILLAVGLAAGCGHGSSSQPTTKAGIVACDDLLSGRVPVMVDATGRPTNMNCIDAKQILIAVTGAHCLDGSGLAFNDAIIWSHGTVKVNTLSGASSIPQLCDL